MPPSLLTFTPPASPFMGGEDPGIWQEPIEMTDVSGPETPRRGRRDLHETADRWLRARRAVPAADQPHAERLAAMIRAHTTDRLAAIDDPLEAAMFSLLLEIEKEHQREQ